MPPPVPHSWSDDPAKKWELLTSHSDGFKQTRDGRAPLLWLDKACLNQEDIAGSLSHLPVHMAGCKALVIVAGPTYTSRLWTLLELFVWLSMGKEQKKIEIFPIERNSLLKCSPPLCRVVPLEENADGDGANFEQNL